MRAGKNQLSAHLEAFLLARRQRAGGCLVKCAPTFRPQVLTSIVRLRRALDNRLTRGRWRLRDGYTVELGAARIQFLSAEPRANVVGATATVLLECDEAQDVAQDKWDKDFRPMGATANVTTVLYGTPWRSDDLLARTIQANREAEARDGVRRHFQVDWTEVAATNPAYGRYVDGEIARLGRSHPIIRTQYLLELLEQAGGFLSAAQLAILQGDHPALARPPAPAGFGPGDFVAGIDVAGADEEDPEGVLTRVNPGRDSTVVMIAHAERQMIDSLVVEPRLRVVAIYAWRGTPHRQLYPQVLELVRSVWRCARVVVDATGVGSGLAAFLGAALGPRVVLPYVYSAATKSTLAYDFLTAVNNGRLKLYVGVASQEPGVGAGMISGSRLPTPDSHPEALRQEFFHQARAAVYQLRANQLMLFSVPEHRGHDDLLNAAALVVQAATLGRLRTAEGRRRASASCC